MSTLSLRRLAVTRAYRRQAGNRMSIARPRVRWAILALITGYAMVLAGCDDVVATEDRPVVKRDPEPGEPRREPPPKPGEPRREPPPTGAVLPSGAVVAGGRVVPAFAPETRTGLEPVITELILYSVDDRSAVENAFSVADLPTESRGTQVQPSSTDAASSDDLYGAIAASPAVPRCSSRALGMAWNTDSPAKARENALGRCEEHGDACDVILSWKNGCAALAQGRRCGLGWAWGPSKSIVDKRALDECNKRDEGCRIPTGFSQCTSNAGRPAPTPPPTGPVSPGTTGDYEIALKVKSVFEVTDIWIEIEDTIVQIPVVDTSGFNCSQFQQYGLACSGYCMAKCDQLIRCSDSEKRTGLMAFCAGACAGSRQARQQGDFSYPEWEYAFLTTMELYLSDIPGCSYTGPTPQEPDRFIEVPLLIPELPPIAITGGIRVDEKVRVQARSTAPSGSQYTAPNIARPPGPCSPPKCRT